MHYQNLGQRPQVKLLCGLLMLLAVRAIPEEKVQTRKLKVVRGYVSNVVQSLPHRSPFWLVEHATTYFHSVGRTFYWTGDLGKTKSASRLAQAGNKIVQNL